MLVKQAELTPQRIANQLTDLLADDEGLLEMARAAVRLDHMDATQRLANACIEATQ